MSTFERWVDVTPSSQSSDSLSSQPSDSPIASHSTSFFPLSVISDSESLREILSYLLINMILQHRLLDFLMEIILSQLINGDNIEPTNGIHDGLRINIRPITITVVEDINPEISAHGLDENMLNSGVSVPLIDSQMPTHNEQQSPGPINELPEFDNYYSFSEDRIISVPDLPLATEVNSDLVSHPMVTRSKAGIQKPNPKFHVHAKIINLMALETMNLPPIAPK
ncbi:hypothetical protein NE237_008193 [Protea cynaroides]|uniref:Uncharacterized protein n=1 Tax=Protea cynaroides TaxID=273540 RepID=A0A9Q0KQY0_9MAGN|nr:hypothetical protein NE237_008193 [Protea cynaroides]